MGYIAAQVQQRVQVTKRWDSTEVMYRYIINRVLLHPDLVGGAG